MLAEFFCKCVIVLCTSVLASLHRERYYNSIFDALILQQHDFSLFQNNDMNTKKALCFLLPFLMLIASKSFGYYSTKSTQYYINPTYLQNEIDNMTGVACPLVFDIVFFNDGENRPDTPIVPVAPECPLRSTIPGGQSVGVPIPTVEGGLPVSVWLEVFDPATGIMLLMKVTVTPDGCSGIIHIEQLYTTHPWDYSTDSDNVSFTPLVGENPLSALTLGFGTYIGTGHLIANIAADYMLNVYYCIPRGASSGGSRKIESNPTASPSLRQLPINALTLSVITQKDQSKNNARDVLNFSAIINNPVRDMLQIRLTHLHQINQPIEASLWSMQGQQLPERYIMAPHESQLDILTYHLSPGLYILRLTTDTQTSTHVFVKI